MERTIINKDFVIASILKSKEIQFNEYFVTFEEVNYISKKMQEEFNSREIEAIISDDYITRKSFQIEEVITINKDRDITLKNLKSSSLTFSNEILSILWNENFINQWLIELKQKQLYKLTQHEEITNSSVKKKLKKTGLVDNDLLRYTLSQYKSCARWEGCSLECSAFVLTEEEMKPVLEIMAKYNLRPNDYLSLYVTYWAQGFKPYKGELGFISDLEKQFLELRYPEDCYRRLARDFFSFPINDNIGEEKVEKLINSNNFASGEEFLKKYNLSELDYMVLAKTCFHDADINLTIAGEPKMFFDIENSLILGLGEKQYNNIRKRALKNAKRYNKK